MSGLTEEQLDELADRVEELLPEQWDKETGRPRELTFREAIIVACGYARNNITEEVWAEIFDIAQSTISRYITLLTPLIDQATAEFRPVAEEAAEATRGAIALVDGTLWPCWSWANDIKLRRDWHQPENDPGQRGQPGCLARFPGLVAAAGPLGLALVAAARAPGDEVALEGDLEGQVGGEVAEAVRGKSFRSR